MYSRTSLNSLALGETRPGHCATRHWFRRVLTQSPERAEMSPSAVPGAIVCGLFLNVLLSQAGGFRARNSEVVVTKEAGAVPNRSMAECPVPDEIYKAQRGLTAATKLEDWVDYAIRSDCAPYSLAQFDNLAQKTRLSRLVVQVPLNLVSFPFRS